MKDREGIGPGRQIWYMTDMPELPLTVPPQLVGDFGSIGVSSFPDPGSYPNHNRFWVLDLMEGPGRIVIAGEDLPYRAGCAVLTPPHVEHCYHIERPHAFAFVHFQASGDGRSLPVVQQMGRRAALLRRQLVEAAVAVHVEPTRAIAALWQVLWSLGDGRQQKPEALAHPAIRAVLAELAEGLSRPLHPPALAKRLGLSPRHLNRLCHDAFGQPLAAWLRTRRLEQARHLLELSDWPIIRIARTVGYPDLQHFNKLLHQHCGCSPSQLRQRFHS